MIIETNKSSINIVIVVFYDIRTYLGTESKIYAIMIKICRILFIWIKEKSYIIIQQVIH